MVGSPNKIAWEGRVHTVEFLLSGHETLMRDTNRVKIDCRALILLRQSHEATIGSHGFRVCSAEREIVTGIVSADNIGSN